jgi:hypothetical protein
MAVQWGLGMPQNALLAAEQGFNMGQQRQQQAREAQLRERQLDQQGQQQQSEQAIRDLEAHRDRITIGAALFEGVQDEPSYQAALANARRLGVDLNDVPTTFDPAYVDGVRRAAQFLRQRSGQGDGFTLSPGQVRYDSSGHPIASGSPERPRYYSVPQGGRLELDPSYQGQGAPAPAAGGEVTAVNPQTGQRVRLNPQTGQWEPVQGGASPSNGSSTFP